MHCAETNDVPKLTIVVARSANFVIGADGQMPWHVPEDLKHFQRVTSKKFVIMGRKTHMSIGRPLPNRWNLIVSRNKELKIPGCLVFPNLEEAILFAHGARNVAKLNEYSDEICLIGGGELYQAGLPYATKLIVTELGFKVEGDTFFTFDEKPWRLSNASGFSPPWDEDYRFVTYERVGLPMPVVVK